MPVLYAVRYNGALTLLKPASKADVQIAREAAVDAVNDSRVKASRHEYHHEQALVRIENELRRLAALPVEADDTHGAPKIDVMLVTSNGAGLGHVSRLLAVAARLPAERRVELLTLSTAYKQVAHAGLTVHYFPSSDAAGQTPERWNRVFRDHIRRLLSARRPRVVVFDGTWVYPGLTDVCRALGVPLVWMQRGMWKQAVDQASPQRHAASKVAEHVVVPGDYAESETVDGGPGLQPRYVGPIVRTKREDLLPRSAACAALGLDPAERYVLLNLGGGPISDPDSTARAALARIREVSPGLTPVQVVSPLSPLGADVPGLIKVVAYPVMPCVRAFEYMIAAAGYNSAQEAVSLGVPTVLVPNADTKTDDQVRRARLLGEKGLCLVAEDGSGLRLAIDSMADPACREELVGRSDMLEPPLGDVETALLLEEFIEDAGWLLRADTIVGKESGDV